MSLRWVARSAPPGRRAEAAPAGAPQTTLLGVVGAAALGVVGRDGNASAAVRELVQRAMDVERARPAR
jgi:hypothetical protein